MHDIEKFDRARTNARLNFERRNDAFHQRKPLTYEQILERITTIPETLTTGAGYPIKHYLAAGAKLLKNNPTELYNYYLLEVKRYVVETKVPYVKPVKRLTRWQRFCRWLF